MRMSENQQFGFKWEKWTLEQLHQHGYPDARLVSQYFADKDIMLGTMPIEVKAARPKEHWTSYARTRWQFDVSRVPRSVDCIVILVAVDSDGAPYPFIVPSWMVWDRYNVHITSHPLVFRGRLAPCLNNWANVGLVKQIHRCKSGQLSLFDIMGNGDSLEKNRLDIGKPLSPHFKISLSPFPKGASL